jgi:hypothetical protein
MANTEDAKSTMIAGIFLYIIHDNRQENYQKDYRRYGQNVFKNISHTFNLLCKATK